MTTSSDDPRPPYVQVADALRTEIQSGRYAPGQKLPSVRALAERFSVAPMTLTGALRMLKDEGVVSSVHGRGTFVREGGEPARPAVPAVAELAERVAELDATVQALSARLDRLEAKG